MKKLFQIIAICLTVMFIACGNGKSNVESDIDNKGKSEEKVSDNDLDFIEMKDSDQADDSDPAADSNPVVDSDSTDDSDPADDSDSPDDQFPAAIQSVLLMENVLKPAVQIMNISAPYVCRQRINSTGATNRPKRFAVHRKVFVT